MKSEEQAALRPASQAKASIHSPDGNGELGESLGQALTNAHYASADLETPVFLRNIIISKEQGHFPSIATAQALPCWDLRQKVAFDETQVDTGPECPPQDCRNQEEIKPPNETTCSRWFLELLWERSSRSMRNVLGQFSVSSLRWQKKHFKRHTF